MTTIQTDATSHGKDSHGLRIRLVYRDGAGSIHFDWPADQISDALADEKGTLWVDLEDSQPDSAGHSEAEDLLSNVFHFHPLAIEDAIQDTHIPKVDDWGHYLYLVFHTLDFDPDTDQVRLHELDLFLGANYL